MTSRALVVGLSFFLSASVLAGCQDADPASAADATPVPGAVAAKETKATDAGAANVTSASTAAPNDPAAPATDAAAPGTDATEPTSAPPASGVRKLEVAAYYTGYTHGTLPVGKLDFGTVDEVSHFAVIPRADGTLDDGTNVADFASAVAFTAAAKKAGAHTTLCIGGAGSESAFALAVTDHRAALVSNIVTLANDRGYDGVDLDWEPLAPSDAPLFVSLVQDLRSALGATRTLTAAVPVGSGAIVAPAIASLDRVHLMTYDLSGPWQGWVTWHNGALFNGGKTFPSTGEKLPSVSDGVKDFIEAGVPASKLMLGIDHQGNIWKGGSGAAPIVGPNLSWSVAPSMQPITYREIADTLLTASSSKWDDVAKVPFLSIDAAGTANDVFVSYEDERSQRAKVDFARENGLAGVFVWDIAASYRPSQAAPFALMASLHDDAKAVLGNK